jgi:ubiquinone/menaquinone biosynthesis C-methylase UbiE
MTVEEKEIPWSVYWAADRIHSCVAEDQQNDQGLLNKVWQDFAKKAVSGAQMIDLATGNGAVPLAMLSARTDLDLSGIDRASIDPSKYVSDRPELKQVKFYPNTDINDLGILDKRFDAVTSQFGIEYAGLHETIGAVSSNLKSLGELLFLIHHDQSNVITSSKSKVTEMKELLEPNGLVETVFSFLRREIEFSVLESSGQGFLDNSANYSEAVTGQIFSAIEQIVNTAQTNLSGSLEMAKTVKFKLSAEKQRLEQMIQSAQSKEEMNSYKNLLEGNGFVVKSLEPFYADDDYLLGWLLSARLDS